MELANERKSIDFSEEISQIRKDLRKDRLMICEGVKNGLKKKEIKNWMSSLEEKQVRLAKLGLDIEEDNSLSALERKKTSKSIKDEFDYNSRTMEILEKQDQKRIRLFDRIKSNTAFRIGAAGFIVASNSDVISTIGKFVQLSQVQEKWITVATLGGCVAIVLPSAKVILAMKRAGTSLSSVPQKLKRNFWFQKPNSEIFFNPNEKIVVTFPVREGAKSSSPVIRRALKNSNDIS